MVGTTKVVVMVAMTKVAITADVTKVIGAIDASGARAWEVEAPLPYVGH